MLVTKPSVSPQVMKPPIHNSTNLINHNRQPLIALRSPHKRVADQFAQGAQNPQHHDSIHHNTLAILAVTDWLTWLDIPYTHHDCDSWDSLARWLSDVSDLTLCGVGRIECRPVLPGDAVMDIPLESQGDRVGYLAIGLDLAGSQAMLLGFLPAEAVADRDRIPLEELNDSAAFLTWWNDRQLRVDVDLTEAIQLGDWLLEKFDRGWQKLSTLLGELASPAELALNYRRNSSITGARVIEMGGDRIQTILSIAMDLVEGAEDEWDITIRLQHRDPDCVLPNNVKLTIFDAMGRETIAVRPTNRTNLQVNLAAEPGEGFCLQLSWDDHTLSETLVAPTV